MGNLCLKKKKGTPKKKADLTKKKTNGIKKKPKDAKTKALLVKKKLAASKKQQRFEKKKPTGAKKNKSLTKKKPTGAKKNESLTRKKPTGAKKNALIKKKRIGARRKRAGIRKGRTIKKKRRRYKKRKGKVSVRRLAIYSKEEMAAKRKAIKAKKKTIKAKNEARKKAAKKKAAEAKKKAAARKKKKSTIAKKKEIEDAVFEKYFLKYKDHPDVSKFLKKQYPSKKQKKPEKKKKKKQRKKKKESQKKKEKPTEEEVSLGRKKPLPVPKSKKVAKPRYRIGSEGSLFAESGRLGRYIMFEMKPEYYGIKKIEAREYNTQTHCSQIYEQKPPPPTFQQCATQTTTIETDMQTRRKRMIRRIQDRFMQTLPYIGSLATREFPAQTNFKELLRRIYYVDPNERESLSPFISEDQRFIVPGVITPVTTPPPPPPPPKPVEEEPIKPLEPTPSEEVIGGEKEMILKKGKWQEKTEEVEETKKLNNKKWYSWFKKN